MTTRTALITGAARGIGLQIARRLADEGFALTLSARREPGLREAAEQLRADGADIHATPADLADESDIERLVGDHAERHGRLDLLVLNGGVGVEGPVAELPIKRYDLVLDVNLRAQFLIVQRALPLLRSAAAASPDRGARVVALSSITGVVAEPNLGAYAASKAGLISLCETITLEEAAHLVTATAISPGYVDTDMTAGKRETLGRDAMLRTDDIAELVLAVSRLSAGAVIPNIVISRRGTQIWRA